MNKEENLDWVKNAAHTVTIEGYNAEGSGVARVDGRVIFVPQTIRGEVWEIILVKTNKNFAFGKGVTCLTGASARVEKDCDFRGRCGGCQYRHMAYEEELQAKREHIQNQLQRMGGISLETPPVLGAEEPNRYRNKVQFPIGGSDKWVKIGFYRPRSHDVLDVPDCLLQSETSALVRAVVKDWMLAYHVNPYDETTGKGTMRHLFLRQNSKGETLVCLVAVREKLPHIMTLVEELKEKIPQIKGVLLNSNKKDTNVVLGEKTQLLWGEDTLEEELAGLSFQLSVPSFFQVNLPQTQVLYQVVEEMANLQGTEIVVDLYTGIGTIALILAKSCEKVYGNEIFSEAVVNARDNALRNNIQNVEFLEGDAKDVAEHLVKQGVQADVVVVDPPRKGLSAEMPQRLADFGAKKLVYVSCDPATLARDVKRLGEHGYTVTRVQGVDLFPRTKHVETVVLLEKG